MSDNTELSKLEKAYGGCRKCYGKGYATHKTQVTGYGTDGDIGGFEGKYKRDLPVSMKFCSCSRGEQLENLISQYALSERIDELKKVREETETGDYSIWVNKWAKNRIASLERSKEQRKES